MARTTSTAVMTFSATLTLTEVEVRALDALVGYGDDAFLKHFKEKLGTAYIRDHEKGLRSAFTAIRRDVLPALHDIDQVRRDLTNAAERRRAAKISLDPNWTCPICDGGPGNNGTCNCPSELKW